MSLAKQMGMGCREQVYPCSVIVVTAFDSREGKRRQMRAIKKPAGSEEI